MEGQTPTNPFAPPGAPARHAASGSEFGDRAGEHLRIARGRYSAWTYVVLAFGMVALAIATALLLVSFVVFEPPWSKPWIADRHTRDMVGRYVLGADAVLGFVGAWWIFRDRWRCIEAVSSRYCSGIMNLSLVYVPVIAAVVAVARGLRKFSGR